jgi:hypothetical protein
MVSIAIGGSVLFAVVCGIIAYRINKKIAKKLQDELDTKFKIH